MHDLTWLIERFVGGDENARKLINENVSFRLNKNCTFSTSYLKLTTGRSRVMGKRWKAARQLKIEYSQTFGISHIGTIELEALVVSLECDLGVDANIRNRMLCYGMNCLNVD